MIRVIGIGSPFGDDRVGWYVVELLRGRVSDTIELLALDRPGAALINWMHGVDWFILIDASGPQDLPGKVQHVDPDRLALPDRRSPATIWTWHKLSGWPTPSAAARSASMSMQSRCRTSAPAISPTLRWPVPNSWQVS